MGIDDPLAQLVEHNTFNVGVLGSSPKRITKSISLRDAFFVYIWALTQGFFLRYALKAPPCVVETSPKRITKASHCEMLFVLI